MGPRRILSGSSLAVGLGGLLGCFSLGCFSDRPATGPTPPAGGNAVGVANFAFVPPSLSVSSGETVTWTNMDDVSHTVSADNNAFESGAFSKGMTFQLTAGAPGTYTYFCRIHPFMKGTLTVTP